MRNDLKQFIRRSMGLLCAVTLCAAAGCTAKPYSHQAFREASRSETSEDWQETNETVILENTRIRFELSPDTTHFTVIDRLTGQTACSAWQAQESLSSEELKNRMESEISLVYYNSDSAEFVMTSAGDSVAKDLHRVTVKGTAARVEYEFGETASLLAPEILPVQVFEEVLCNRETMDAGVIRRISRYYTLFSPEDAGDEDYEAAKTRYPVLAKQALYVLNDTVDTLKKMEISDACAAAGITEKQVAEIFKNLHIEAAESDEPGFRLTVEYALTEDGFTAEILSDTITELSANYHLQKVLLLEYFAAVPQGENGSFLVPDGSGALISFGKRAGNYSQPVYGADGSIQSDFKTQLSAEVLLPALAVNRSGDTVLAIAESGEETASVNASAVSLTDPVNHAWFSFGVRAMDVTDIGTARNIPVYNLYGKHIQYAHPKVRYCFLAHDPSGWQAAAEYLRTYYITNGMLAQTNQNIQNWLLDFHGLITEPASFLGIPYKKKITLSRLNEIIGFLESLSIPEVSMRLSGCGKEGTAHGVNDRFSLNNRIGSVEELKNLLGAVHGTVYLDADFQTVLTDRRFDGYSLKADTAKYINRSLVQRKAYDIVTRQFQNSAYDAYLISPACFSRIAEGFLSSLAGKHLPENAGLSYPGAGGLLYGDYSNTRDLDRAMSRELIEATLRESGKQYPILTENGYIFALGSCSALLNMPLGSSEFDLETESVPLYQAILHGSLSYFGAAYNLSSDRNRLLLRSLEYGAGLYWSLITGDEKLLGETDYETAYYSVQADGNRPDIITLYQELDTFYRATASSRMCGHRQVGTRVFLTEYENGAAVAVNYGQEDADVNGKTVKAGGYVIWLP